LLQYSKFEYCLPEASEREMEEIGEKACSLFKINNRESPTFFSATLLPLPISSTYQKVAMATLYSSIYSTTRVQGATLVPSPVFPSSTFASTSSPSARPTLLLVKSEELLSLLPTVKQLATSPIVLQVSTIKTKELAPVLALRGSGLSLLYSDSQEAAKANAAVAARVAASGHGVVHFGEFEQSANLVEGIVDSEWIASNDKQESAPNGNGASHESSSVADLFSSAFAHLPSSSQATAHSQTGSDSPKTLLIALGNASSLSSSLPSDYSLVTLNLYRPLSPSSIRALVPSSVETIVVLEQVHKKAGKWSPVFLDVVGAFAEEEDDAKVPKILSASLGEVSDANSAVQSISGSFPSPFSSVLQLKLTDSVLSIYRGCLCWNYSIRDRCRPCFSCRFFLETRSTSQARSCLHHHPRRSVRRTIMARQLARNPPPFILEPHLSHFSRIRLGSRPRCQRAARQAPSNCSRCTLLVIRR